MSTKRQPRSSPPSMSGNAQDSEPYCLDQQQDPTLISPSTASLRCQTLDDLASAMGNPWDFTPLYDLAHNIHGVNWETLAYDGDSRKRPKCVFFFGVRPPGIDYRTPANPYPGSLEDEACFHHKPRDVFHASTIVGECQRASASVAIDISYDPRGAHQVQNSESEVQSPFSFEGYNNAFGNMLVVFYPKSQAPTNKAFFTQGLATNRPK
ncbi:hypothetical protein PM082_011146 [Marasmius tenuissimus]|nr:hypothetical protein PM082_011146 [Marasmius tenuissimus]